MPRLSWTVEIKGVDQTSKVLSFNINQGRESYIDPYSGGRISLTINNASNYAGSVVYGDAIRVYTNISGYLSTFWVESITYNDYPGGVGLNTATIIAADSMGRSGRILANAFSITAGTTGNQADQFEYPNGPMPNGMAVDATDTMSSAPATTYTGTVLNYFNLLTTTERGFWVIDGANLRLYGRQAGSTYTPMATTFGRTTSSTQIAYQSFQRIQAGTQYINTATIEPGGLASQTAVNTTSLNTYGPAFYSSATVDNSTTQALGNAQWIADSFGDPQSLRFECSFTDVAQDSTALTSFLGSYAGLKRAITLSYTVPGGSPATTQLMIEGININVTPELAEFTFTMSPLTYYQFFTLDSSTLGILDTSRLGW